jgi:opacity protein-like surface antigen
MRVAIISLAVLGLATNAFGADLDDDTFIRGSADYVPGTPVYYNWGGFYGGGQVGYGNGFVDSGTGVSSLIAFILRDTTIENEAHVSQMTTLGKQNPSGRSYGVFVGYNMQWENVVLGLELNYNRPNINSSAADQLQRSFQTSDGYFYNINLAAQANLNITDYGTLRGRAGWAFGRFLPYLAFGVAVGRAESFRSATVTLSAHNVVNPALPDLALGPTTLSQDKIVYPWGFAAGLGMDVALMPWMFLRGEYEFVQFGTFSDTRANIQTVRVGAALKY